MNFLDRDEKKVLKSEGNLKKIQVKKNFGRNDSYFSYRSSI